MMYTTTSWALYSALLAATFGVSQARPLGSTPTAPIPPTEVFHFPGASPWPENLVVRSDGSLLVTRLDSGALFSIPPTTGGNITTATPLLDLSAQGYSSLAGIAEVRPDLFAFIAGKMDVAAATVTDGSWAVFTVDLSATAAATGPAAAKLVHRFDQAGGLNGLAVLSDTSVLVADSSNGVVYSLVVASPNSPSPAAAAFGTAAVALNDSAALGPGPGAAVPFGIDGLKYRGGTAYFTNILQQTFGSVTLDAATGQPTGPLHIAQTGLAGDDLCFSPRDGSIFVTTNFAGTIVKLGPDGTGTPEVVAEVPGASACAFGRTAKDEGTMYVTTAGSGQVVSVKLW